jgi:hypothetical protein
VEDEVILVETEVLDDLDRPVKGVDGHCTGIVVFGAPLHSSGIGTVDGDDGGNDVLHLDRAGDRVGHVPVRVGEFVKDGEGAKGLSVGDATHLDLGFVQRVALVIVQEVTRLFERESGVVGSVFVADEGNDRLLGIDFDDDLAGEGCAVAEGIRGEVGDGVLAGDGGVDLLGDTAPEAFLAGAAGMDGGQAEGAGTFGGVETGIETGSSVPLAVGDDDQVFPFCEVDGAGLVVP